MSWKKYQEKCEILKEKLEKGMISQAEYDTQKDTLDTMWNLYGVPDDYDYNNP